jgi:hypothetical protein
LNQHIEALKKNVNIYSDRELTDFASKANFNKLNSSNYSIKEREETSFARELEHVKKSLKMLED